VKVDIQRIDLTLQLLAHTEIFHRSIVVTPQLDYRIGDHMAVFAGCTLYEGKRE